MIRRPDPPTPGFFDALMSTNDSVQAARIQALSRAFASQSYRLTENSSKQKQEQARLESELGFLSLIVAATLRTLADKGLVTTAEVLAKLEAVDAADGVKDGKISVDILRAILGAPRAPAPIPQPQVVPKPMLRRNR